MGDIGEERRRIDVLPTEQPAEPARGPAERPAAEPERRPAEPAPTP